MTELVGVAELIYQAPDVADDEEVAARYASTTFLITAAVRADVEAVARRIHAASRRAAYPFVRVSSAELPTDPTIFDERCANLLGEASGGSLLLMDVEGIPRAVQESVLETIAALQSTRDPLAAVRVIAGTTAVLHDCVASGTFSERLFYRLNIMHIVVAGCRAARNTAMPSSAALERAPAARNDISKVLRESTLTLPGMAHSAATMNGGSITNVR